MQKIISLILLITVFSVSESHASWKEEGGEFATYLRGGAGLVYGLPTVATSCGLRVGKAPHFCDLSGEFQCGILANALSARARYIRRFRNEHKLKPYIGGGASLAHRDLFLIIWVEEESSANADGVIGIDWRQSERWSAFVEGNISWPVVTHNGHRLHWRTQDPFASLGFGTRYHW